MADVLHRVRAWCISAVSPVMSTVDQINNVKGIACSDVPTDSYHPNLQSPLTLWSFLISHCFASLAQTPLSSVWFPASVGVQYHFIEISAESAH